MTTSSRVGLELELLAPEGSTRLTLARALASKWGARVQSGFKYHGAGFLPEGRPDCRLSEAFRVVRGKEVLATLVDDPTIVDDLDSRDERRVPLARTDDVRLALWLERRSWAASSSKRLSALVKEFDAREVDGVVFEPLGHPLVAWTTEPAQRQRVCEVVLPPLTGPALGRALQEVCAVASKLGFLIPAEGAVHAHFDAAAFRSTKALRRLMSRWMKERSTALRVLEPNPRCRKLGPYDDAVMRVVKQADDALPFATFAAALELAGLHRAVDVNVLGVVERFPKQPTVEVRCLPSTLDAEATLRRVHQLLQWMTD